MFVHSFPHLFNTYSSSTIRHMDLSQTLYLLKGGGTVDMTVTCLSPLANTELTEGSSGVLCS